MLGKVHQKKDYFHQSIIFDIVGKFWVLSNNMFQEFRILNDRERNTVHIKSKDYRKIFKYE